MPYVVPKLVAHLLSRSGGVDVVVPIVRGYVEPLCAAYRCTCLRSIEELIECGVLKVSGLYQLVNVHEVGESQVRQHDPELRSFVNLNGPVAIRSTQQRSHRQYR